MMNASRLRCVALMDVKEYAPSPSCTRTTLSTQVSFILPSNLMLAALQLPRERKRKKYINHEERFSFERRKVIGFISPTFYITYVLYHLRHMIG